MSFVSENVILNNCQEDLCRSPKSLGKHAWAISDSVTDAHWLHFSILFSESSISPSQNIGLNLTQTVKESHMELIDSV